MTSSPACDKPRSWTLAEFDKLVRQAIHATGLYSDEARSGLLRKLHCEIETRRMKDERRLTEQDAWDVLRTVLTLWPFAGGLHGLDDRERRKLVSEIQHRIAQGTVTQTASAPEPLTMKPGPDGWDQFCIVCGDRFHTRSVLAKFCSDRCRVKSYDRRVQARKEREQAALAATG